MMSFLGSQWAIRERQAECQHRREPLLISMTSAGVWWCRLLPEEKSYPQPTTKNTLRVKAGSLRLFRITSQSMLNSLLLSPWKALLSLTVPLLLCFHLGILLVFSGSWFYPESPDSILSSFILITAPNLLLQVLLSHQSEAPIRPKTRALPLEIVSYGPTRGHRYPSKVPLFLPYQGPVLRKEGAWAEGHEGAGKATSPYLAEHRESAFPGGGSGGLVFSLERVNRLGSSCTLEFHFQLCSWSLTLLLTATCSHHHADPDGKRH